MTTELLRPVTDPKSLGLYPFQTEAIESLRVAARAGHHRIILCAPTGSGKCLGEGTDVLMADGREMPVALDLPAGQDAADQTARDSAAAAQSTIETHEESSHNTDTVARSTARNARQVGEQAQTTIETHEASTHNHDAMARTAARAAQTAADAAAAAGAGRVDLYKDTADYSRTTASTVFRQFDLSRAPARGKGLELVIANVGRTIKTPLYVGTTDDFLDLTVLTTAQLNGVISAGTVPVAHTIPVKSIALDESNSNSFGHGIVYVGRVNDTRMGVGIAQRRGVGERFRMTVREIP